MGLPFLKSFSAPQVETATREVGGVLTNANQDVVNYDFASGEQKVAEAVTKLVRSGDIGAFSSVARGIGIAEIGSAYAATDEPTGKVLGVLGAAPQPVPPAGLVGDTVQDDRTNQLKVILRAAPGGSFSDGSSYDEIVLKVMPRISEQRDAQYDSFTPVHHPGVIQKYRGTGARTWSISARLISRTSQEALENLVYLNLLRAWIMPFYGEGTAAGPARRFLGAPPPIITLTAYGSKMIGPVKTVLTNYSWDFPNDVDYIATPLKEPFPVILDISLSLVEAWSPSEHSGFNIIQYRHGNLSGGDAAFKSVPRSRARSAQGQVEVPPAEASSASPGERALSRAEPITVTRSSVQRADNMKIPPRGDASALVNPFISGKGGTFGGGGATGEW